MQISQRYMLTIYDLFTMTDGVLHGANAEVAVLNGEVEIDRMKFSGKVGPDGPGFRRSYAGKPGLSGKLVSGQCQISFKESGSADVTPAA